MRRLMLALVLPLFVLPACSKEGRLVQEPRQKVLDNLNTMPFNANVFYLAKQVPHSGFRSMGSAEGVDWIFSVDGKDICRFSAKVADEGGTASRVTTAVEQLGAVKETYLCDIARITGEESVAATLENRSADVKAVSQKLTQYLVSNMGAATEMVSRKMDEMAPPKGQECEAGDADMQARCRQFMARREQEMKQQGFAQP